MNELLIAQLAQVVQQYGIGGLISILIGYLIWQDRHRAKQADDDRIERQKNTDADRAVWTNHLSQMINEDSKSREQLAVGLTKLSESVNNFQTRCGQIQTSLQNEVDRLRMKG